MISTSLNLLRLGLWPRMWSVLDTVACALEEDVYCAGFGRNALYGSTKFPWSSVLPCCFSVWVVCPLTCVGAEVPLRALLPVSPLRLGCWLVLWVLLCRACAFTTVISSSWIDYMMFFFISCHSLCFKVHFVRCKHCYPSFF